MIILMKVKNKFGYIGEKITLLQNQNFLDTLNKHIFEIKKITVKNKSCSKQA